MKLFKRFFIAAFVMFFMASSGSAQDIHRSFEVSSGGLLVLDLETGGTIVITAWDRNEVDVSIEVDGRDTDEVIIDFENSSRTVEIYTEFESRRSRADVDMEIRVPRNFNLDISTTGGDLMVDGVSGKIEGASMGGDLELSNLSGTIDMTTMGGDIMLSDSEIDGRLHTMGGDVDISDVTGNIKGTTMGGDVTYDNVTSPRGGSNDKVEISTMGGDVEVSEALYGVEVSTMGGDIYIESAGEFVTATTMGGDITIEEINGWIEANTMGGDIEVKMVGGTDGDRHVELESMGGSIELTLPPGLSIDIDIEITLSDDDDHNYEILSDFDLTIEFEDSSSDRRWRHSREVTATGSVRGGRNKIIIRTVDGDVILREGR